MDNHAQHQNPFSAMADLLQPSPPSPVTALSQVRLAYDRLITLYAEILSSPKPDYSIDGQQIEWGAYVESLSSQLDRLRDQLVLMGDPEFAQSVIRTRGV